MCESGGKNEMSNINYDDMIPTNFWFQLFNLAAPFTATVGATTYFSDVSKWQETLFITKLSELLIYILMPCKDMFLILLFVAILTDLHIGDCQTGRNKTISYQYTFSLLII